MTLVKKSNPRRTYIDNIEGISHPALQRIMHRAGVKRISSDVYEQLRNVIKDYTNKLVHDMVIFIEYDRRKTAQIDDLDAAVRINNMYLAAGISANAKKTKSIQSCKSVRKSGPVKKKTDKSEESLKKPHRFRPGTQTIRAIRYQQKNSDCLAIPKANFSRLIRELAQEYKVGLRFSDGVLELIQLVVEDYIISICTKGYKFTLFAGRDTIQSKDIQMVLDNQ